MANLLSGIPGNVSQHGKIGGGIALLQYLVLHRPHDWLAGLSQALQVALAFATESAMFINVRNEHGNAKISVSGEEDM